jgi:hypothetical protein
MGGMPVERRAECPSCGRPVRLTEPELIEKRGFCAVCDTRFDVLPDMLLGDGPMRSLAVTRVSPSALREGPPSTRIQVHGEGGQREVTWHPSRAVAVPMAVFVAVWMGFSSFIFGRFPGFGPFVFVPAIFAVVGVVIGARAVYGMFGAEKVRIENGRLIWTRGVGPIVQTREARLADITDVRLVERERGAQNGGRRFDTVLHVGLLGAPPIEMAGWAGFDRHEVDWLREHIAAAVREARRLPAAPGDGS